MVNGFFLLLMYVIVVRVLFSFLNVLELNVLVTFLCEVF